MLTSSNYHAVLSFSRSLLHFLSLFLLIREIQLNDLHKNDKGFVCHQSELRVLLHAITVQKLQVLRYLSRLRFFDIFEDQLVDDQPKAVHVEIYVRVELLFVVL